MCPHRDWTPPRPRACRSAASGGRVLGRTAPAMGSQQQSCAPPLKLEDQKGPHLPSGQILCSGRSLKYPFLPGRGERKTLPTLQQGKPWLEKDRRAVRVPQGESCPPSLRQTKPNQPVCVVVPQLYLCCSLAESTHLSAPAPLHQCGEAQSAIADAPTAPG